MRRALAVTVALLLLPAAPATARSDPFAGIHRNGLAVGDPGAPVTIYAHLEPQCPFCRRFDRRELPDFVDGYVRTGRARLVLRPVTFLGHDSVRAARAIAAAALQDRAWELADQLYRRQGPENSGWVTDRLLRRAAAAVPGLNVRRMMRARGGRRARALLKAAREAAARIHYGGTPAFSLETATTDERLLHLSRDTAEALGAKVDKASPPV